MSQNHERENSTGPAQRPVALGPKRTLKRRTAARHNATLITVVLLMAVLSARLVWIQGINQTALAYNSVQARLAQNVLPAARGAITDARGAVLADTLTTYDITLDPAAISEARLDRKGEPNLVGVAAMVPFMAKALGKTDAELTAILTAQSKQVEANIAAGKRPSNNFLIKAGVSAIDRRTMMNYAREHLLPYYSKPKQLRIYPSNEVGANLLGGLTKTDQTPIGGLELSLNKYLTGKDGIDVYEQGLLGQTIPNGESGYTAPVNGSNVQLSIDADVQWKAQQECTAALAKSQGDSCTAAVVKIDTGAVVALAEAPTYDANNPGKAPAGSLVNRSISDVFEPGSTGKVITIAAALEEGSVTPLTQYDVPYQFTTSNGQRFKDSESHPDEKLTTAGVLAESSNTGTVQVGSTLPASVRYQYLKKFNMGTKTGVELPGESQGLLSPYQTWDGRTNYTTMFGQGYSVNALQQVSVYATVANKGVRMPIHLVESIKNSAGEVVSLPQEQPTRVITAETSDKLMRMLEGVVSSGTGKSASVAGYQVAGKTGTAEILGDKPGYVASFIGIAPAEKPQYVVGVFVRKSGGLIYGSTIAAPVFTNLMSYVLQKNSVPPSLTPANPFPLTWGGTVAP